MGSIKTGDIVVRRSYGGDLPFLVAEIINNESGKPIYVLRGLVYRILADSYGDDLVKPNIRHINYYMKRSIALARQNAFRGIGRFDRLFWSRLRKKPGIVLHMDSSEEYLGMCEQHYRESGVKVTGRVVSEKDQPEAVRQLLERNKPDILVLTGHDGYKKSSQNPDSLDNYSSSKYFIQAVKEARRYEPDYDNLCIFAGACQSYFEGIMGAGANFASSPGRVLIHALDPAFVSEKVALTRTTQTVTPEEVASLAISGSEGIGGIRTKGHMTVE